MNKIKKKRKEKDENTSSSSCCPLAKKFSSTPQSDGSDVLSYNDIIDNNSKF